MQKNKIICKKQLTKAERLVYNNYYFSFFSNNQSTYEILQKHLQ
mgnify:CR=1 FL=1